MSEAMNQALMLLGQGMAGIFVVLGAIAIVVTVMQKVDQRGGK